MAGCGARSASRWPSRRRSRWPRRASSRSNSLLGQRVIARASQLFLPTLRDDPADAEAVSHKLLVRGGFVRQVAAGIWSFAPLGWRVQRKIEQIIREELAAFGAQEWLAP